MWNAQPRRDQELPDTSPANALDMHLSPATPAVSSDQGQAAEKKDLSRKSAWMWFAFGLLGFAPRVWLWWYSIGCNDILLWASHAQSILIVGVARTYERVP